MAAKGGSGRRFPRFATIRARTTVAACLVVAGGAGRGRFVILAVLDAVAGRATWTTRPRMRAEDIAELGRARPARRSPFRSTARRTPSSRSSTAGDGRAPPAPTSRARARSPTSCRRARTPRSGPWRHPRDGRAEDDFRIVAPGGRQSGGGCTVYVAANLDRVKETAAAVRQPPGLRAADAARPGRRHQLVRRRAGAPPGRGHPGPGGRDLRPRPGPAGARARHRRRDRPAGTHHERHARAVADLRRAPAALRGRRVPRAPEPAGIEPAPTSRWPSPIPSAATWQETASELLEDNERMERLVSDLLFLARADEAVVAQRRGRVDLDDIVLEEAARLRAPDGSGRHPGVAPRRGAGRPRSAGPGRAQPARQRRPVRHARPRSPWS